MPSPPPPPAGLQPKIEELLAQVHKLEAANTSLREMLARLLRFQDEEKRRIARDLHDSTGQLLAVMCIKLSALERKVRSLNPQLAGAVAEIAAVSKQVSTELRALSYLIYPSLLDEAGLASALRWHADGFRQRTGIKVALEISSHFKRLPRPLEVVLFRAVQECLENIHEHSGSPTVRIRVIQDSGRIMAKVSDRGKGIAPNTLSKICSARAPGIGLRGLRERIQDFGGSVEIASRKRGTNVTILIPTGAAEPAPFTAETERFSA